jgi:hypothetical protein
MLSQSNVIDSMIFKEQNFSILTSKGNSMLCLSYYCLFLLFNGTGENCRTSSAWNGRRRVGEDGGGDRGEK